MEQNLIEIGLTQNEAKTYLTLSKTGNISAGKLASKCGLHRRTIYDILERLISKGLVGYIKINNIKEYSISNPENLINILKKKEKEIELILPELNEIYNRNKSKKETIFYKGKEGIKYIFEDQIREKKEIMIIGGSTKAYDLLKYYLPHYEREREKYNIKSKIIFDTKQKIKIKNAKTKYVNYSLGPTAINIYGNKVAIIVWSENPYAILINDENVASSYIEHFKIIWNSN